MMNSMMMMMNTTQTKVTNKLVFLGSEHSHK